MNLISLYTVRDLDLGKLDTPMLGASDAVVSRQFFLALDTFPEKIRDRFELVRTASFNAETYEAVDLSSSVVATYADYRSWSEKQTKKKEDK